MTRALQYRQPGTDPDWPTGLTDRDLDLALERNDVAFLYRVAGSLMVAAENQDKDAAENRRLREALEEAAEDSGEDAVAAILALKKERDRLAAGLREIGDLLLVEDDPATVLIRRVLDRVAP